MSVPFGDWTRTSGSSAATGIDVHDSVTAVGRGLADGVGDPDGDVSGLGVGEVVGEGIAGDTLMSDGEGVDPTRLVTPGLPQAKAIEPIAIATPIRTRFIHLGTVAGAIGYRRCLLPDWGG